MEPKYYHGITNEVQRTSTGMRMAGAENSHISKTIDKLVAEKNKNKPLLRYTCTCNNWGPRWFENSNYGCCDGCFLWSLDHHYEYGYHGKARWLTVDFTEGNTWGIRSDKLRELLADRNNLPEEKAVAPPQLFNVDFSDWVPVRRKGGNR